MQPAGAGQPQLQAGLQQAVGVLEQGLGPAQGQALEEGFGGDSGPAVKEPLEMKFAETYVGRHFLEAGLVVGVAFQVGDGQGHPAVIAIAHEAPPERSGRVRSSTGGTWTLLSCPVASGRTFTRATRFLRPEAYGVGKPSRIRALN